MREAIVNAQRSVLLGRRILIADWNRVIAIIIATNGLPFFVRDCFVSVHIIQRNVDVVSLCSSDLPVSYS